MTDPADAIRALVRVRQVREFTDEPVDPAALDAIADAARWSGSSKNTQPWRFITIREPTTLRALAEAGPAQTRGIATAQAAIAIVMPEAEGKAVSFAYDEARAAERILIAATLLQLGAGISWIIGDVRPRVAALLGLPEDRFVRTIVSIGHPSDAARRPKSPRGAARLPREETVLSERWPD